MSDMKLINTLIEEAEKNAGKEHSITYYIIKAFEAGKKEARERDIEKIESMHCHHKIEGVSSCPCPSIESQHTCKHCEQPEEPTLWEEFERNFQIEFVNDITVRDKVKEFLKSKLLELAKEVRVDSWPIKRKEDNNSEQGTPTQWDIAWREGYNRAVKEANQRLDTFISKLKGKDK